MSTTAGNAPARRRLRLFAKREEGGTNTIEFVLWFPLFLMIFLWIIDGSFLLTRATLFERALDIAVRDIRLGVGGTMTYDRFKDRVCEIAKLSSCDDTITVELRPVSTITWAPLPTTVSCVDREENITPVTEFNPGSANELMLVRACMYVGSFAPSAVFGLRRQRDALGGYRVVATSAFVNEPR